MITISFYGLSSVLCFGLPVFLIIRYRLYGHLSLLALLLYYLLTIFHCFTATSVPPVPDYNQPIDVFYTYLELPLVLSALMFFSANAINRKLMYLLIAAFALYEMVLLSWKGVSASAALYLVVPGLSFIVLYSAFLFLRQMKFSILHRKNYGRVLMLGAILFSYATYLLVFYSWFILKQKEIAALYQVYFIASTLSALAMAAGLYITRQRIKELHELRIVRKELQMVFGS